MRFAVAGLLVALLAGAAAAHAADRRVVVDPEVPPWNAIAKVQTNTGAHCTGVLIAPTTVLTAAHCLYNRLTGVLLGPVSLHVLFGYQRDQYRWHRLVAHVVVGPGFDGARHDAQASDWARLTLVEGVPVAPLPLYAGWIGAGLPVALAGYNQDRAQLLMADLACRVLRTAGMPGGEVLVLHDCAGTRGTSGAPLLSRRNGAWRVIGINIAAGPTANLAVSPAFAN